MRGGPNGFQPNSRLELEGVNDVTVAGTNQVFHRAVDQRSAGRTSRGGDMVDVFADKANCTVTHQEVGTARVLAAERLTACVKRLGQRHAGHAGCETLVVQLGDGTAKGRNHPSIAAVG